MPPAVATVSSPQGCSVGPLSPHKHLERAGVQPGDPVPEGQAQVPGMHEVAQRQHQASGLSPGALGCGDRQVLSACNGKAGPCVNVWHPSPAQTVRPVFIHFKVIGKESQVIAGESDDLFLRLPQIPWFCVYRKHSPVVPTGRTRYAKDTQGSRIPTL